MSVFRTVIPNEFQVSTLRRGRFDVQEIFGGTRMTEVVRVDKTTSATALVVDLDGTLIRTDMLVESAWKTLRQNPLVALGAIRALVKGKANFKYFFAEGYEFDPGALPYSDHVIQLIYAAKANDQVIILASASHQRVVDRISEHLGLFDHALGSSENHNLSGDNKADWLDRLLGKGNYSYVGNSKSDLALWKRSSAAVVVGPNQYLIREARKVNSNVTVIKNLAPSPLLSWLKQLRIHQWIKNLLLFVPAVAAFQFTGLGEIKHLTLAFFSFGMTASAVYILNDAIDVENDRLHPIKRFRPMAAGHISLQVGLAAAVLLLTGGVSLGLLVGVPFLVVLGTYIIATSLYSFWLKKTVLIDCIVLAGLYTLRIVAGGEAAGIKVSFWLLAFSVFFFLSLAWVKRYAELEAAAKAGSNKPSGRGYSIEDLPIVLSFGSVSGFLSILIFALYLDSSSIRLMYQSPEVGWLAIPVMLYLIARMWLKAHRGEMNEDPIVFALKDKASLLSALLILLALSIAHFGVSPWS